MGSIKLMRPASVGRSSDKINMRAPRSRKSVARPSALQSDFGADAHPSNSIFPTFVDGEIYDDAEIANLLNVAGESCHHCETRSERLVALIRFPALDKAMALCGECYRNLLSLVLGHVT